MPSIGSRRQRKLQDKTNAFSIRTDALKLWLAVAFLTWPAITSSTRAKLMTKNDKKPTEHEPEKDSIKNDRKINYGRTLEVMVNETIERTLDDDAPSHSNRETGEINDAISFGIRTLEDLVRVKEPFWYKLGLILDPNEPASKVANFGAPRNDRVKLITRYGEAALEAAQKIASLHPGNAGRKLAGLPEDLQSRIDLEECPLRGRPVCPPASNRFRTADGTCNNMDHPWRGSSMFPMQRFIAPVYEDGLQRVRLSLFGDPLPSPRQISKVIHVDRNKEVHSVTLMFMQWGQFIDHDVTSTVKMRSFNDSVPRCCDQGGRQFLHPDLLHPACLPIQVAPTDPFLSRFGIRCIEFTRSAPSSRIDCQLGWREQINQVTSYIDASTIYGSDVETANALRTFRDGKIFYGRAQSGTPLNPPDPPGGEVCREGAVSEQCFQPGDGRVTENIGLVAMHTIFIRYHNRIASVLGKINPHWSDDRIYQETRKIVYSVIQHITYREYLPIVLGPEVMDLFELKLLKNGYYDKYNGRVNPTVSNSFSTAAFRFGHSLVQNSFIRTDSHHNPLIDNVTLHEEFLNFPHIWSRGSLDRLMLGLANQPSQKRDEFIAEELTNHLFQFGSPFGMDLVSINIQRGRDHGIPPYTYWRKPCALPPIKSWKDMESVMNIATVVKLRTLYQHVDDVDLFTGGLAEKPLKGAVTGPTFACIIAQQFSILRRGDRFWYENGDMESSFSQAQLNQIRKVSLAQVLCQTMIEIETIQPFVFLSPDDMRNMRIHCESPEIRTFDLGPWTEQSFEFNSISDNLLLFEDRSQRRKRDTSKTNSTTRKRTSSNTTDAPQAKHAKPVKLTNMAHYYQINHGDQEDVTYLLGIVPERTTRPNYHQNNNPSLQVNINIQYPSSHSQTTTKTPTKKRPTDTYYGNDDTPITRPFENVQYPTVLFGNNFNRPNINTDKIDNNIYSQKPIGHKRPNLNGFYRPRPTTDNFLHVTTDRYDDNDNFDLKPTYFETNNIYPKRTTRRPIIFENRPFSSSNLVPQNNFHAASLDYDDDDDDTVIITKHKRKPTVNLFEDKEQNDDIVSEFFQNQRKTDKKPSDRNKIVTAADIDDKLDFKSRLAEDSNEQNTFVHLSSVRKQEIFDRSKRDINNIESTSETFPKRYMDENNNKNEFEEVPELKTNYPCSYQVPRPMDEYFATLENVKSNERTI
ncbi:hypothetical protein GWI33_005099 [Rhynchophorus ferrugineus]|uniref:Uncharacterized protein n=1 Tax=Rhynchophorus ferrugineus TaxID=354439 RepID=A0A834ISU4_RHYFE|nr:hypothetical protein GWI33_005099 [Rhynchophorus ferrugineus]